MRQFLVFLFVVVITGANAQTIFSYGNHQVTQTEFWKAYSKNNTGPVTEQSIREYLDLYIRFKLKVQAAYDAKLDTLPNITSDVAGFRAQIIDQYMRQQPYTKQLITEAAERSNLEVEVAHVFIAYLKDSTGAKTQIDKAYAELQQGADFGKTAAAYSNNNYVKSSNGYIGFISVFSLPYEFESIVYGLQPGTYSKPVSGKQGWHIFKVISKRPASGKMKAAHILFAIPPGSTTEEKALIQQKAQTVYYLLSQGEDFEKTVLAYSNDRATYMSGGVLPDFTYATYDPTFSKAAFALTKDGEISKPVLTAYGWHIIKRIGWEPVKNNLTDPSVLQEWTDKVNADPRYNIAVNKMKDEMKKVAAYKQFPYNEKALWALTDSTLKAKNYAAIFKANKQKQLFQLKGKTVSVADWLQYAKSRNANTNEAPTFFPALMKEFVDNTVEQYYKDRLESINQDFLFQLNEFKEGSLLFEVMERKIWSVAPTDTAGLIRYYNNNKSKYKWQASVNAVIFNCADTSIARQAFDMMKENPGKWKEYMDRFGGNALADSGRFEYSQLPVKQGTVFTPNTFTPIETNANDGSSSFCYIIKNNTSEDQRSFEEAKGLVINDYQTLLEDKWIADLKKKYPLKVNEAAIKKLVK
ncbi:MAG: peptidylprolyl isomerase [Chitinophagaceae bacterium]